MSREEALRQYCRESALRGFKCNEGAFTFPTAPPAAPPAAPAAVGAAPLTVSELASFTPVVGELRMQPDGWAVAGRPTNFYATAAEHTQDGELLGQPVQVRWRPVGFTFDYGDGTVSTVDVPGGPWRNEDAEWSATDTTHVYEERGARTASVTVSFAADVLIAGSWLTVADTLAVAAPPRALHVYEVSTVLTRGTCIEYPEDPGCPGWDPDAR